MRVFGMAAEPPVVRRNGRHERIAQGAQVAQTEGACAKVEPGPATLLSELPDANRFVGLGRRRRDRLRAGANLRDGRIREVQRGQIRNVYSIDDFGEKLEWELVEVTRRTPGHLRRS